MKKRILKIIPYQIGGIPENIDVDAFKGLTKAMGFSYQELKVQVQNKLSFIDCGESLTSIKCNHCLTDASPWWSEYMTEALEDNFENRMVVTPCCNQSTALEKLIYKEAIGFSKFTLELINPSRTFTDDELHAISDLFGCVMKVIDGQFN